MLVTQPPGTIVHAVIFDKDGTLLDFHATWDKVVAGFLRIAADGDEEARLGMANAIGFDPVAEVILPNSPVIAESNETIARLLAPWVTPEEFHRVGAADATPPVAMVGAAQLLMALRQAEVPVAIATNDSAQIARRQMEQLGWTDHFDAVVGFDSGHGAKPEPGMVIAAGQLLDATPAGCVMVGDSPHDILAGQAAGMQTASIGANPDARALADHCFDTLAELHVWLLGAIAH